ncbi:hypothetical protein FQN52_006532 [Onygenales sp. PD_12]|nr:hypothetical protein FQN52_006532 [Onygenales sp. PD_12]
MSLRSIFRVLKDWRRKQSPTPPPQDDRPRAEEYPTFPPLSPEEIIRGRQHYSFVVSARKYAAPQGVFEDSSLYALYRLYEYFVLDEVFAYRNVLEWLWRQPQWQISEIPDPQDETPSRYAFLACVTYLIVRSFNARVKLGLVRGGRAIMTMEESEEAKNRPESERQYERVPLWAENVPPLTDTLTIPTLDGTMLSGKADERADPDFLAKNIVLWTPHIHFT